MSRVDKEPRRKGTPPNTPYNAPIGGEYGYCKHGIGGCTAPKPCLAEGHCIDQYLDDRSEEKAAGE